MRGDRFWGAERGRSRRWWACRSTGAWGPASRIGFDQETAHARRTPRDCLLCHPRRPGRNRRVAVTVVDGAPSSSGHPPPCSSRDVPGAGDLGVAVVPRRHRHGRAGPRPGHLVGHCLPVPARGHRRDRRPSARSARGAGPRAAGGLVPSQPGRNVDPHRPVPGEEAPTAATTCGSRETTSARRQRPSPRRPDRLPGLDLPGGARQHPTTSPPAGTTSYPPSTRRPPQDCRLWPTRATREPGSASTLRSKAATWPPPPPRGTCCSPAYARSANAPTPYSKPDGKCSTASDSAHNA